jgi:hydrogenase maturation protein HypF
MLLRHVNTIPTSSAGRLFDAVASLIGLRHTVSFEGQAAMMLEATAETVSGASGAPYEFALTGADPVDVDLRPMIRQMVAELDKGASSAQMAGRFHATLIALARAVCRRMRDDLQLQRVCLSGGCFQNGLLLAGCLESLQADGFEVFMQRQVPANDGGISLGQAAVACEILRQGA